ncbi:MAG: MFS transporter [Pseudomonadota bacterium]
MPEQNGGFPSPYRAWYVVFILFLAYTFSAIDRQILTLLVEPVRADLGLSDFEISLLQGFAFSLLFAVAGFPIARLSDSRDRRRIIAAGITFWCVMTAMCGMAKTFVHLFLARMGVGVGEATLSPAAASLLSDYFEPKKRALAISVYHLGYPVGGGLALVAGAAIIDSLAGVESVQLGWLGSFKPWQLAFILVGLPGLVLAAAMFSFREPVRRGVAATAGSGGMSIREVVGYMRQRWKAYGAHFSAVALMGMLAIGTTIWYPTFLIRTYGLTASEAGYSYGLIMGICGALGILLGGALSVRIARRGYVDANMRVMLIAASIKLVPVVVGPLMPTATLALITMAIATFLGQVSVGVTTAAIQDITPNQMRAQATAMMLFLVNIVGLGLGATFIAFITDFVFGDDMALRYSIVVSSLIIAPTVITILAFGLKHFRACVYEIRALEHSDSASSQDPEPMGEAAAEGAAAVPGRA